MTVRKEDKERFVSSYVAKLVGPKQKSDFDRRVTFTQKLHKQVNPDGSVVGVNLVGDVLENPDRWTLEHLEQWERKSWGKKSCRASYSTPGAGGKQNRETHKRPSLIVGKCFRVSAHNNRLCLWDTPQVDSNWHLIKQEIDSHSVKVISVRWRNRERGDFLYMVIKWSKGTCLVTRRGLLEESVLSAYADTGGLGYFQGKLL